MVLMMARQEACPQKQRPNSRATFLKVELKMLRCELENNSCQPRNLTENRQSDSLNKRLFLMGLMKGGELLSMKMRNE
jgi:hypothetical protein